ncbi:MAG: hypothetical protein SWK90_14350 [Chloroflexota bacterium]|nr:hypothetical protein [Chloroflexota bacterium]
MTKRKRIPKQTETQILTQSRRRCCLCFGLDRDLTQKRGQIAHLDQDPSNDCLDNLAYLCLPHHDQYDSRTRQSKGLTINEVKRYRDLLYAELQADTVPDRPPPPPPSVPDPTLTPRSARRPRYALIGLFVGAAVDLLINLIAAAVQQRAFADQFTISTTYWLVGLSAAGLLLGHWLGADLSLPMPTATLPHAADNSQPVTITRLRALLSYAKLRGKGIALADIMLIGSRLDIQTNVDPKD